LFSLSFFFQYLSLFSLFAIFLFFFSLFLVSFPFIFRTYVISVETNTDDRTITAYNLALAPGNVINMNDISGGTTSMMTTMGFSGFSMTSFTLSAAAEYYAVEHVDYMDANNLETDGITANGYVSRVVLQKLSDDEMPATVAVALYKSNGQLQNIVTMQIDGGINR
jgi:hypothetical protein